MMSEKKFIHNEEVNSNLFCEVISRTTLGRDIGIPDSCVIICIIRYSDLKLLVPIDKPSQWIKPIIYKGSYYQIVPNAGFIEMFLRNPDGNCEKVLYLGGMIGLEMIKRSQNKKDT